MTNFTLIITVSRRGIENLGTEGDVPMEKKIKVLMVDDEAQFRATTQKILNRKGFETIIAGSGEEALGKLDDDPDVVILDIKMPGIDGHQALQEIKKRKPDLPVIMLTGHGALPSATAALGKGAFDYLSKPCDIELLAAKVKEAYQQNKIPIERQEKRVHEAMVPIEEYTTLSGDQSVADCHRRTESRHSPVKYRPAASWKPDTALSW